MTDHKRRKRIHKKIRARVKGTKEVPRLSVYRSNKHIYAQLISDDKGETILSVSDLDLKNTSDKNKTEVSEKVGKEIGKKAKKKGIKKVVFDRGGFDYHGRVKAVAEGARESGLKF